MQSGPSPLVSTASRPHPARLDASSYPVHHTIDARYGDMDVNGHLNNVALGALHENCRATLHRQALPAIYDYADRRLRIVAVSTAMHYLREGHWPAKIHTGAGIGHLGRTSFVSATALFIDDECISLCDTVLVMLDDDGPTPIPDDARTQLAMLHLSAADTAR